MPFTIPPFAKVLALFFIQGLVLWGLKNYVNESVYVAVPWMATAGTLVAWWAMWLALHPERTWQPWLECLALMGATFWVPVIVGGLLHLTHVSESRNPLVDHIIYVLLSMQVVLTLPLALLLCGVRWTTGWRLQATTITRQVGLRELFLLMLCVGLHLAAFQPQAQEVIRSYDWSGFSNLVFWLVFLLYLSWAAMIVLGAAMLVLGQGMPKRSALVIALGSLGLAVSNLIGIGEWPAALQASGMALITLYGLAFANAFALRAIGYRLVRRPRPHTESQPSEPLVP